MRTVVCAYGEVGYSCLSGLLDIGADIRLVVTHKDAPDEKIWFSSVADLAVSAGLPVIDPEDVNASEVVEQIAEIEPQLLYSLYFRQMMKAPLLACAEVASLNLHGSLLPAYRGRCPVNWVLVNGEKRTGVTLHHMDEKPDHGDIVARREVEITRDETALSLTRKLAQAGRHLIAGMHGELCADTAPRESQDHSAASYFGGRRPSDGAIDWSACGDDVRNLVRAVTDPWPGAFAQFGGRRLFVWAADTRPGWDGAAPGEVLLDKEGAPLVATGTEALELLDVTWEGEARRSGTEWASAAELRTGDRLEHGCGGKS